MESHTPARQPRHATPVRTPVTHVLQRVEELTPKRKALAESPFSSPALRRLDEAALRDRLREAYYLLKEKERNLFLAATVGQELVETNQQLQESYEKLHTELIETQQRLDNEPKPGDGANRLTDDGNPTDRSLDNEKSQSSRLHGRRRSMALQVSAAKPAGSTDAADKGAVLGGDVEKEWMKLHVQPLKAQLLMAQERTDELLAEREELAAQVYSLRQEHSAAVRRSNESTAAVEQGRRIIERLEEDKARAECELEAQRAFWAKRWSDHQAECKAGALAEEQAHGAAQRHAEDAAARIRAEQRADELQLRYSAAQAETELLRSQMQRVEEERVNEWEPMRAQWLGCESALQELHETHQSTCEALAQAEARLAELDKSTQLNDPLKPKTEKASTSLLGELDLERHQAVAQRQALVREHMVLKRAYARALNTQSRMKQQVNRLAQLAATGANEARMKRLEAALGEAECQQQALLWASMEQRRQVDTETDSIVANPQMDETALVTTLRAKLKRVTADREQAQRELRTAHLLRANEIQRTRELERDTAELEAKLRRTTSELSSVKADHDSLKRTSGFGRKRVRSPKANGKPGALSPQEGADSKQQELDQPLRKRTRVHASEQTAAHKKSGPMSLAFVVNDQAASTSGDNHPESSSPITNATEEPTNTMPQAQPKRRRVSGTPSSHGGGGRTSSTSKTNTASVPAKDSNALFEFNDAADRGMKSCLDTLGTVHAAAAIPMSGHQQSELPSSAASEHSTAGTAASPDSASRESSSAKEIYVGSRSSQKQIECNNQ